MVLSILFLINIVPILVLTFKENDNSKSQEVPVNVSKGEKDEPNIYWIHPDGMLGAETFRKYFDDDAEVYLSKLEATGFTVNRNGYFDANHKTSVAIPVLMNPHAYDKWIKDYIKTLDDGDLPLNIIDVLTEERKNNELIGAMGYKGYADRVLSYESLYYPREDGVYYEQSSYSSEAVIWDDDVAKAVGLQWNVSNNVDKISEYLRKVFSYAFRWVYEDAIVGKF